LPGIQRHVGLIAVAGVERFLRERRGVLRDDRRQCPVKALEPLEMFGCNAQHIAAAPFELATSNAELFARLRASSPHGFAQLLGLLPRVCGNAFHGPAQARGQRAQTGPLAVHGFQLVGQSAGFGRTDDFTPWQGLVCSGAAQPLQQTCRRRGPHDQPQGRDAARVGVDRGFGRERVESGRLADGPRRIGLCAHQVHDQHGTRHGGKTRLALARGEADDHRCVDPARQGIWNRQDLQHPAILRRVPGGCA